IYGAVRDENWATLPYDISDERMEVREQDFTIRYQATYTHQDQAVYRADFVWQGRADGSIVVEMKGTALAGFTRNRIGLCVLHPPHLKGTGVEVSGSDARVKKKEFPRLINPHQVLTDVRAIKYATGSTEI